MKKMLFTVFMIFIIVDCWLFNKEWFAERKMLMIELMAIVALVSLPLMIRGIYYGHDIGFHMNRIEGIAESIRRGEIPARTLPSWINGYGYPALIYYGNLLLYIPAVFRIIGFSVTVSFKMYIFIINVMTVLLAYYSFGSIIKDKKIALLSTLAYSAATYRLINVYMREALGEYTAMVFFPLVFSAMFLIYTDDTNDKLNHLKYSTMLAIGMTGIIESHTLSTEIIIELLVIFCLIKIRRTIRLQTIKDIVLAIGQTVLLNLFFIVPFLDYYINVKTNLTDGIKNWEIAKIQSEGIQIGQLFAFFQNPFLLDQKMNQQSGVGLTMGALLMSALVTGVVMVIQKTADKKVRFTMFFSLFLLFLASDVFPWDHLAANYEIWNYMAQIEFPWRYLAPACLVLSAMLGFIIQRLSDIIDQAVVKHIVIGCIITAVAGCFLLLSQYVEEAFMINYYDGEDIQYYDYVDYLKAGLTKEMIDGLDTSISVYNMEAQMVSRDGGDIYLDCQTGDSGGTVTVPVLNYKGYIAKDDKGRSFEVFDDEYGRISVSLPERYEGMIRIYFQEPFCWRISEIISLLSFLLILYSGCQNRIKNKRK